MREVLIDPISVDRLSALLEPERATRLQDTATRAVRDLDGRVVWNVNATAQGGGVAEMLQSLVAYGRGAGVDTRWLVLHGNPEFFALTKRIHNSLHGSAGAEFSDADRRLFDDVSAENLAGLAEFVRAGDIVVLHDPQTAGLVAGVRRIGAYAVWRCHIGKDASDEVTDAAWQFLRRYVEPADAFVFTRAAYVPRWVDRGRVRIIPPSLDPFTAKNEYLPVGDVLSTLRIAGIVEAPDAGGSVAFTRRDGSRGTTRPHEGLVHGGPLPADARVVLQVSRWDDLKDMQGVLTGFARRVDDLPADAHLMLVGPDAAGVSDDPEGARVLDECLGLWRALPPAAAARVHLCVLPMDDGDENAHIVDALQRYASIVVQKSLVEGFGLTVTEAMWKAKPVVASNVGGIADQIVDGVSGVLLDDPADLDAFADALVGLLHDDARTARLATNAHERARAQFLGDRHLAQSVDLFRKLLANAR
ncbi:glycosyltransferase [Rhodococcus sp. HNM0569]|uniref:glycosyltransferase n=1 Tax=Rhodococcus sp. HNM0569 TaxID=2716340 RepID=UPI00146B9944|nr:glycosyltransferase [Rhodococcus sp. HNM0569]NLU85004.1 glycosyltransferase [Rhodococcus sp. HNM0569]